jgi:hypothetical protein
LDRDLDFGTAAHSFVDRSLLSGPGLLGEFARLSDLTLEFLYYPVCRNGKANLFKIGSLALNPRSL